MFNIFILGIKYKYKILERSIYKIQEINTIFQRVQSIL